MKDMKRIAQLVLVTAITFTASLFLSIFANVESAYAVKVPQCGRLPQVVVEDLRNIRAGIQRANKEFLNQEGKLPRIDSGFMYNEYDIDQNNPNLGDRGRYRAVGRVKINTITPINPLYVTLDHYRAFCETR
ncbi:MAG TPA: ribonuclease domain-containing protein [Nostocaceae cyanobacterium]|nr:ribonuclease domain-containing protein [Nostocaceae cyanobacterium]